MGGGASTEVPDGSIDVEQLRNIGLDSKSSNTEGKFSTSSYDVFITHDGDIDELGRDNHARVARINEALVSRGIETSFDTSRNAPNAIRNPNHRIHKAQAVIVFITKKYEDRMSNTGRTDDVCREELVYAMQNLDGKIIPVVMEPTMKRRWTGMLGTALNGYPYTDLSNPTEDFMIHQVKVEEIFLAVTRVVKPKKRVADELSILKAYTSSPAFHPENTKPFGSLTKDELILLFKCLKLPNVETILRNKNVNGQVLMHAGDSPEVIRALGFLTLTPVQLDTLITKIRFLKEHGVPQELISTGLGQQYTMATPRGSFTQAPTNTGGPSGLTSGASSPRGGPVPPPGDPKGSFSRNPSLATVGLSGGNGGYMVGNSGNSSPGYRAVPRPAVNIAASVSQPFKNSNLLKINPALQQDSNILTSSSYHDMSPMVRRPSLNSSLQSSGGGTDPVQTATNQSFSNDSPVRGREAAEQNSFNYVTDGGQSPRNSQTNVKRDSKPGPGGSFQQTQIQAARQQPMARKSFNSMSISEKISYVVEVLEQCLVNQNDSSMIEGCLRHLVAILSTDKEQQQIVANNVQIIDHVVQLLAIQSANQIICPLLLTTIKLMSMYGPDKPTVLLGQNGACEVVLTAVISHPTSIQICLEGCWCIRQLSSILDHVPILTQHGVCEVIVQVLQMHVDSVTVVEAACAAVINLSRGDTRAMLGQAGGCEAVVRAFTTHIAESGVAENACAAIANLSVDSENSRRLSDAGVFETLVFAVRGHLTEPRVVEQACTAITNLAFSDSKRAMMGKVGAAEAVVLALKSCSSDRSVVDEACAAIGNLAFNPANLEGMANAGAPAVVMSIAKTNLEILDDAEVVESICSAVAHLAKDKGMRKILADNFACELIVDMVGKHGEVATVLEVCCWALCNLMVGNEHIFTNLDTKEVLQKLSQNESISPTGREKAKMAIQLLKEAEIALLPLEKIITVKDLSAVFKQAIIRTDDEVLCTRAFQAIPRIIGEDGQKQREVVSGEDIIKNLIEIMCRHLESKSLSKFGLVAIKVLCRYKDEVSASNPEAMTLLSESGVCEVISEILTIHQTDVDIAKLGCSCVLYLSNNDQNRIKFGDSGACEAVTKILKSFSLDPNIAEDGAATVASLAFGMKNKDRFGKAGIAEVLVKTLRAHKSVPKVVEFICTAIVNISQHDTNRQLLGDAGACEIVVDAVRSFISKVAIAEAGCWCIKNLVMGNEGNRRRLLGAGADVLTAILTNNTKLSQGAREQASKAYQLLKVPIAVTLQSIVTVQDVISSLRQAVSNQTETTLATRVLESIPKVIGDDAQIHQQLGDAEAVIENVITLLKKNISNPTVCFDAVVAIKVLCRYGVNKDTSSPQNMSKLVEGGAAEVLVLALRTQITVVEIVEQGLLAIRHLGGIETGKTRLGAAGACEAVVSIIRAHLREARVAEQGCAAISTLSKTIENNVKLGVAGACESVISVLRTHNENALVIIAGCLAINRLMEGNPDNKHKLFQSGGYEVVSSIHNNTKLATEAREQATKALESFQELDSVVFHLLSIPEVCEQLEQAAYNLGTYGERGSNALIKKALECIPLIIKNDRDRHRELGCTRGVAENVVQIMKKNVLTVNICLAALVAVKVLCRFGPDYASSCQENIQRLGDAGACEYTLFIMKAHMDDPSISEQGSWAIRNLAATAFSKTKLNEAGACDTLVSLLRLHKTIPSVSEATLGAIANLAADETLRARLVSVGAPEVVIQAINLNLKEMGVCIQGCAAIANLGYDGAFVMNLFTAGACDTLVTVIRKYPSQSSIIEAGCLALGKLMSQNDDITRKVLELNPIDVLNEISTNTSTSTQGKMQATKVVKYLREKKYLTDGK